MAPDPSAPDLAALRREYGDHGLDVPDLAPDPVSMFRQWMDEAIRSGLYDPTAMIVSTVSATGRPSSSAPIRSRLACTSSRAESSPPRTRVARSPAGVNMRSLEAMGGCGSLRENARVVFWAP